MEGFSSRSTSMGVSMGVSLRRASMYRHEFGLLWAQRRETPVIVSVQDDHLPHPKMILAHTANRICRR